MATMKYYNVNTAPVAGSPDGTYNVKREDNPDRIDVYVVSKGVAKKQENNDEKIVQLGRDLDKKADKSEVGIVENLIKNGNLPEGNKSGWTNGNVVLDTTINKYVFLASEPTSINYIYQDILIPSTHKVFVSALIKNETGETVSVYLTTSDYGGLNNTNRTTVTSKEYIHVSKIVTVTDGSKGIRFNFQTNIGKTGRYTDAVMLDLTSVFGEGNEPTLAEMNALMSGLGWYFDTANLSKFELSRKADKSYVDQEVSTIDQEMDSLKASTYTIGETNTLLNNIVASNYMVDTYSRTEYVDGFFVFLPEENSMTYQLDIASNSIISVDFSTLIEKYGAGKCRLVLNMSSVKNINFLNNIDWATNKPNFDKIGTYVIEALSKNDRVIMCLSGYTDDTPKVKNVLYVDNSGYTDSQLYPQTGNLLVETATRETSSWTNPYIYLQNAINAAIAGDEIRVKQGTYKPTHLQGETSYVSGNCKNINASFTLKSGVNIYGGYNITGEQNGNKTILSGDINNQVTSLQPVSRGDRRKDSEKTQSTNILLYGNVQTMTYIDGFELMYGSIVCADSSQKRMVIANSYIHDVTVTGSACVRYLTLDNTILEYLSGLGSATGAGTLYCNIYNCEINNCYSEYYGGGGMYNSVYRSRVNNCYALYSGGGLHSSIIRDCEINNCESGNNGGGIYRSTIYDSIVQDCLASNYGGAWFDSTALRCRANRCTATVQGGGWRQSNSTQCIAFMCKAGSGGGWMSSNAINCIAANCKALTANNVAGWTGVADNCIAINCQADTGTAAWYQGTNRNCIAINCVGTRAVRRLESEFYATNCLLYGNKNLSGGKVGYDNGSVSNYKQILKNCAHDTANPTGSATATGSDFDTASCISLVTLDQIKINIPSFVGYTENEEQIAELEQYIKTIALNLTPYVNSLLIGAGINSDAYPAPEKDFVGKKRGEKCTIGALEG